MTAHVIYHITPRAAWQRAQQRGEFRAASLHSEGFMHCSGPRQVVRVANAFYRGKRNLVLLVVDPGKLKAPLRHERVDGGRFPHIYGPLNLDAVVQLIDFPPRADGTFSLPKARPFYAVSAPSAGCTSSSSRSS